MILRLPFMVRPGSRFIGSRVQKCSRAADSRAEQSCDGGVTMRHLEQAATEALCGDMIMGGPSSQKMPALW